MRLQVSFKNTEPLTSCETAVLHCLCHGMMRKEIARRLFKSYSCISKHVESIARKLDAHSAAEIVAKAVAHGIVDISLKGFLAIVLCSGSFNSLDNREPWRRPPRVPVRAVRIVRNEIIH